MIAAAVTCVLLCCASAAGLAPVLSPRVHRPPHAADDGERRTPRSTGSGPRRRRGVPPRQRARAILADHLVWLCCLMVFTLPLWLLLAAWALR